MTVPSLTFAHNRPLAPPPGMQDYVEPESVQRRQICNRLLNAYRQHGYQLVDTSALEYAKLMEEAYRDEERENDLQLVDPQSSQIVSLRPDMTVQMARIIGGRLHRLPPPWRLCYEGHVFRQRSGIARTRRDLTQIGLECVGLAPAFADLEIVDLVMRSCELVGLTDYFLELNHAGLGNYLLSHVPSHAVDRVAHCISTKDQNQLELLLKELDVKKNVAHLLLSLIELYGDIRILQNLPRQLKTPAFERYFAELGTILKFLDDRHLIQHVRLDLGELRHFRYYNGVCFRVLAEGPGQAIAEGGRYEMLLARLGDKSSASGFAFDVDSLLWSLRLQEKLRTDDEIKVAFGVGTRPKAGWLELADALRREGVVVSLLAEGRLENVVRYARDWRYHAVFLTKGTRLIAYQPQHPRSDLIYLSSDLTNILAWLHRVARNG